MEIRAWANFHRWRAFLLLKDPRVGYAATGSVIVRAILLRRASDQHAAGKRIPLSRAEPRIAPLGRITLASRGMPAKLPANLDEDQLPLFLYASGERADGWLIAEPGIEWPFLNREAYIIRLAATTLEPGVCPPNTTILRAGERSTKVYRVVSGLNEVSG